MKKHFLLLMGMAIAGILYAQPKAIEGKAEFQKTQQPAAMITVPYNSNTVEDAIADYMTKKGIKGGSTGGYKVYRNYKLASSIDYNSDLYFKVDRKSRSEKDVSVISLLAAKTAEDIKTRKLNDSTGTQLEGAKELLDEMVPAIEAYSLEVQIRDQEAVVKKAQKKYDDLVNDQKDYEKKIRNLEDKLAQNKKDQVRQSDAIKSNINGDDKAMLKAQKRLRNLTDDEADYDKSMRSTIDKVEQSKRDQVRQQEEIAKQQDILNTLISKRKN